MSSQETDPMASSDDAADGAADNDAVKKNDDDSQGQPELVGHPVVEHPVDADGDFDDHRPVVDIGVSAGRASDHRATTDEPKSAAPIRFDGDARLHVSSLWLPAVETISGAVVPLVIGSFFVGPINVIVFYFLFVFLPVVIYYAVRYFTLTYRVASGELVIRSGLLSRRERRIPLDRVQEVEIHQSIFARLLGYAKVDVSTAGSDSQEAALHVLTKTAAEQLKRAISDKQRIESSLPVTDSAESDPEFDYECALDLRTLVIGGLTTKVVATLGAVIGAVFYFQGFIEIGGEWVNGIGDRVEEKAGKKIPATELLNFEPDLPDTGLLGFLADVWMMETLSKSIMLAIFGLGIAVVSYVIRFHGFRLGRSGGMLSTSYGLLNFRHGSLSRDRIQALKLEESLLRRWFGMAAVRADSAGDHRQIDENKNRDVLVPVASLADAEEVARQAIPGLHDLTPDWQRVSPLAIMRGSKKGWLMAALVMLLTYFFVGWYCLAWLPAFPLVYLLNYKWYQHTGYWSSEEYLLVRTGWINRSTICIPVKNIQSVTSNQNFFDRRLHLASLSVDIAGQSNTGGGPSLRNVPIRDANSLQRRLANLAGESEFRW